MDNIASLLIGLIIGVIFMCCVISNDDIVRVHKDKVVDYKDTTYILKPLTESCK
jgi:hypothetical protein